MQDRPIRSRHWQATDRTGGPLDEVLDALRRQHADLAVKRLGKTYAADDDNVYFRGFTENPDIVQVDIGPDGQPSFTVEADDRIDTTEPAGALAAIRTRLNPTQ